MTTIRVTGTFHISGGDCLTVVGTRDGPLKRGDTLLSDRGVQVKIVAIGFLTRVGAPGDQALCVQPEDADVQVGDVLRTVNAK